MANDIVPLDQIAGLIPAKMQERRAQGLALNKNFIEGIRDAFPTLSIKGKVFRFRHQGVEQAALDEARRPVSYLDVILVNGSPTIAKTYYEKGYVDGSIDPPDCWSTDSIKPDPSVVNKQNPTCLGCEMNRFGSRVTDRGVQAKACQDQRRIAITLRHQLDVETPLVALSRIPQTSLKNLKAYADMLERYGVEINGVITRLSFDPNEAYPKLLFEYAGVLNDDQYDRILELAETDDVRIMLNAPITESAEDNLDPTQTVRTPPKRPVSPANVTPLRPTPPPPAPAPDAFTKAFTEAQPDTTTTLGAEAAKVVEEVRPASNGAAPPIGVVALGDGKFYNPITQSLCDSTGQPVGDVPPSPPAEPPPMTAAQAEAHRTWVPSQAPTSVPPAEPAAQAAPKATRSRRAPAAEPTQVQAAAPALDSLLSKLMPKQ